MREVLDVDDDTVLFLGSDDPVEIHLWTWSRGEGTRRLTAQPGVHGGRRAGGTTVIASKSLAYPGTRVTVGGDPIASVAETPKLTPRVELFEAGGDRLRTGVVFPTGHRPGDGPLLVLMDPYGGPGGQRVLAAQSAFLVSQWFADQGFVVRYPDLNLSRVGIRGWSFGGYLATLAVLRRPDVFHAAVAGAPVTDQRLYDTHWQERYLGHPDLFPQQYDRSSLLADAPNLRRPLIRIHGLLDDNVHPAHTMRLSGALLAAGRPHTVVPLSTATHGPREQIANLLVLEAQFLNNALAQRPG